MIQIAAAILVGITSHCMSAGAGSAIAAVLRGIARLRGKGTHFLAPPGGGFRETCRARCAPEGRPAPRKIPKNPEKSHGSLGFFF